MNENVRTYVHRSLRALGIGHTFMDGSVEILNASWRMHHPDSQSSLLAVEVRAEADYPLHGCFHPFSASSFSLSVYER